ncbi:NtaA/DmoA family FMN-dependent monooxygenase [Ketogulonicigenium vulgare]|uniref:NtaA/DmoA family FMN-dependent monooxygenase n=1 Tax=Ketogulonicigenium vulgare TaxID=92945 RepID=UPI002359E60E|nr:NtaA/DmoA family FMN-dependent monooxygenase [Ketogulonicigenium vulgare]
MATRRKLCIGMSLAPTWLSGEGWRADDSNIDGLFSSDFALDIARMAEAVHLDFVFRPDTLYLPMERLEQSFGFTSLDSTMLMAAIARETSHIGLVTTVSTTLQQPYLVARQLMSLHWLSKGRAGWNIVTAMQGQENFGMESLPKSEDRYAEAAEFTDVVHRLWASFPADAVLADRASGRYADTSKIHPINHAGRSYRIKGPLNLPAYPGPRVPLIQAGASGAGRDFAAATADIVFAMTPDFDAAKELRDDLSARAVAHGRAPEDIRVLPGIGLYLGETRVEAEALFSATHARIPRERRLDKVLDALGLDLRNWPDARQVTAADLPPAKPRTAMLEARLRRLITAEAPTVAQLLNRHELVAAPHWTIVGTVEDAVAEIAEWHGAGVIDGMILAPCGSTRSMHIALQQLVPALARAGLFRSAYTGTHFADHLGIA